MQAYAASAPVFPKKEGIRSPGTALVALSEDRFISTLPAAVPHIPVSRLHSRHVLLQLREQIVIFLLNTVKVVV